jgi:hypothetical protein
MAKSGQQRGSSTSGSGKGGSGSARRKLEQVRREQRARAMRLRALAVAGAAVVIAAVVAGIVLSSGGGSAHPTASNSASPAKPGPEGIALEDAPALAPASTAATGQTVNGIACDSSEQAAYHIHTHLAVFVDGGARQIPLGIGTVEPAVQQTANGPFASATRCYYWLHTHAADGIIHVESPTQRTYTLGDFFAIWRQPLSAGQAGPAKGTVTAFVNGHKYGGDPRAIPLGSRTAIQLDVGKIVPPQPVDWSKSQL